MAIFNWTTGTSISIVDVQNRRFAAEIETPGCSLVYPTGHADSSRFFADGAVFTLTLDDEGREASRGSSKPFFDPQGRPGAEKAVRVGSQWYFVSFDNVVHPVDAAARRRSSVRRGRW